MNKKKIVKKLGTKIKDLGSRDTVLGKGTKNRNIKQVKR